MIYDLVVRCKARPMLHAKTLRISGKDKEWVEILAKLLDGTSPFYVLKPGDLSPIGKCATCGTELECEIKETHGKGWQNRHAAIEQKRSTT